MHVPRYEAVTIGLFVVVASVAPASIAASGLPDRGQSSVPSGLSVSPSGAYDYTVTVRDADGDPIEGAELTLDVLCPDLILCPSETHCGSSNIRYCATTDADGNATITPRLSGECCGPECDVGAVVHATTDDGTVLLHLYEYIASADRSSSTGTADGVVDFIDWTLAADSFSTFDECADFFGADGFVWFGDLVTFNHSFLGECP